MFFGLLSVATAAGYIALVSGTTAMALLTFSAFIGVMFGFVISSSPESAASAAAAAAAASSTVESNPSAPAPAAAHGAAEVVKADSTARAFR